jgi:multiple sugar transport system permease protein
MLDLSSGTAKTVFALLLALVAAFLFFPIYWLIISAFKGNAELYRIIPTLYPHAPTLEHLRPPFVRGNLLLHLQNSLLVSSAAAALNTVLAMYAGYSFAKFRYPGAARSCCCFCRRRCSRSDSSSSASTPS